MIVIVAVCASAAGFCAGVAVTMLAHVWRAAMVRDFESVDRPGVAR